jgi:hypothetical protein
VLEADVRQDGNSPVITLRTDEKPLGAHGAKLVMISQGEYELTVDQTLTRNAIYQHIKITVNFGGKRDQ